MNVYDPPNSISYTEVADTFASFSRWRAPGSSGATVPRPEAVALANTSFVPRRQPCDPGSYPRHTVGTSLFFPNLAGLASKTADLAAGDPRRLLATAYAALDWIAVAAGLAAFEPTDRLLERITEERPYVRGCGTTYRNPGLRTVSCFRLKGSEIEGVWSNGPWTVKFRVGTSATTEGQVGACLADLNGRLEGWG